MRYEEDMDEERVEEDLDEMRSTAVSLRENTSLKILKGCSDTV